MAKQTMLETAVRVAQGVFEEIRRRDEWVYCVSEGNLPNQGGKLVVHYLGRKRFADDFLMFYDRDTVDASVRQNIMYTASLPRFLKERHDAKQCPEDADIFIVDHLLERSGDDDAITLAPHINAVLPVQKTMEEQLALIRSKGHRRRLQASMKKGISCRKTHSLADFNLFYDVMYEPFVHDRFRYGASLVARDTMRKMFMHRGYLLLVEEDGIPVSGAFIYTSRKDRGVMYYWKYGLAHSKELSPNVFGERNAAQEAAVLKHAIDEGFREIDWGLTRAVPTDGIFTHKKRMGCDFKKTPGAPDFRIMVNPQARGRLLARFPLVVSHKHELIGLISHEGDLSGKRGKELGELLSNVAFPSIACTRLLVGKELCDLPELKTICDAVSQETGRPIQIETL